MLAPALHPERINCRVGTSKCALTSQPCTAFLLPTKRARSANEDETRIEVALLDCRRAFLIPSTSYTQLRVTEDDRLNHRIWLFESPRNQHGKTFQKKQVHKLRRCHADRNVLFKTRLGIVIDNLENSCYQTLARHVGH